MSEWISVKERLPEPGATVLVYGEPYANHGGAVTVAFFCPIEETFLIQEDQFSWFVLGEIEADSMCDDDDTKAVTHWMPIEEPPK